MGTEPTVTCRLCGRHLIVTPDGRGFPPDIARRKPARLCRAAGCRCEPQYRAGVSPGLAALLGEDGTDG